MLERDYTLPRGFHDRVGQDSAADVETVRRIHTRGRSFGCELLHTPPLVFAGLFGRGRELPDDKLFSFEDKAGRRVSLVGDSAPVVMRMLLENGSVAKRVCFVSPIFRYRHQNKRYFHQAGFAIAGEESPDPMDHACITLARQAAALFQDDFGMAVRLRVTDLGAWHQVLGTAGWPRERAEALMRSWRTKDERTRMRELVAMELPGEAQSALSALLPLAPAARNAAVLERSWAFVDAVTCGRALNVEVVPGDLHGSEMQDGLAFQVLNERGRRCGDGGCYTRYARRFHPRMSSYKSFATGVELLARAVDADGTERTSLLLLNLGVPYDVGEGVAELCRRAGLSVIWRPAKRGLAAELRELDPRVSWVAPFGPREYASGIFELIKKGEPRACVAKADLVDWLCEQQSKEERNASQRPQSGEVDD